MQRFFFRRTSLNTDVFSHMFKGKSLDMASDQDDDGDAVQKTPVTKAYWHLRPREELVMEAVKSNFG